MKPEKQSHIIAHRYSHGVWLLIPKRRGFGFLKSPVGHNTNPLHDFIIDLGFECASDIGMLSVSTTQAGNGRCPEDWRESILKPIAEFLGFPYKICDNHLEFFELQSGANNPVQGVSQ